MDRRKSFQRKAYGLNCFDTFLHFSTEFLDFASICCCFHSQWHIVMSYWWPLNEKHQNIPFVTSGHNLTHLMASVESNWILWRWYYGFSQKFRGFNVFFIAIRLILMSYWGPMNERYHFFPIEAELSVFIYFRWKPLNLMSLILGGFLENFVVLTYLLIFVFQVILQQ